MARIDTRGAILDASERLFATEGVASVSNRQISEAAGLGNNSAVGYHFGTKAELVRAILRRHTSSMEWRRGQLVDQAGDSSDVRDWIVCLVRPTTDHFASLGANSFFARFSAQLIADPAYTSVLHEEALSSDTLARVVDGIDAATDLPARTVDVRKAMATHLIVQTCADLERAMASGPAGLPTWEQLSVEIVDGLYGLWTAPSTSTGPSHWTAWSTDTAGLAVPSTR